LFERKRFCCAGVRKNTVDLSTAVQKAARLEAAILPDGDQAAAEKQEQVASLLAAAEAIIADQELREFMTERNRAAIDASIQLFGNKGVIKVRKVTFLTHIIACNCVWPHLLPLFMQERHPPEGHDKPYQDSAGGSHEGVAF
jgi:hypothetical protein